MWNTLISPMILGLLFMLSPTTTSGTNFNKSLEREALLAANYHWWRHDNVSSHCTWPEIICNEEGSVVQINAPYNFRCYTYPCELESLAFSAFPNLGSLWLDDCMLRGVIPEQIGLLSNLSHLSLRGNYLYGKLPISFTNLTQLVSLDISHNSFTGILPSQMKSLKNLDYLQLSENRFTGPIPTSFGSMFNLTFLDLSGNHLNSSIPSELGNLHRLQTLDLSSNHLNGIIPFGTMLSVSFTNLTQLEYLDLSHNDFSGSLPYQIGSLRYLVHLGLSRNRFTGTIPSFFGSMVDLAFLDLSSNHLKSSIPRNLGNLQWLQTLNLSHNDLVDDIPSNLVKSWKLLYLDFSSNQLSGNIVIPNPCYLKHLDLSKNLITRKIPSQLSSTCFDLEYLDLSNNNLVGVTPDFSNITNLKFLNLSQNHLTQGRKNKLILYLKIFLPIMVGLCLFVLGYACYHRRNASKKKIQLEIERHGDVDLILNYDGKIAYQDFINATEDFDLKYCIGTGGYGSVYEAKLPSGKTYALKNSIGMKPSNQHWTKVSGMRSKC